ncbi:thiamine-phosphate kinase [Candidatus Palibaumannia cicadellinicola]|uniref:Thiamine-monophosphate kinase n=1 Tax=Candidatus Palibaumannia cicadellinicola TaxID=186490 RepID=A0A088MYR7_9GAMM|nr:thiamine-phosphate kinase [Candidatus Baumannia cicadellinicola]AIN47525.1 Thiamine-monophosphate kinase [Candidatus Baumannia cicadellinicola]
MACGEFELINRYFNQMRNTRQDVLVGIGDDCALLSVVGTKLIAISTDTLVAGTHFLPEIDPIDLGYKSLAVNLSDLAAMGADPSWLSLSLTLPSVDEAWIAAYSHSLFQQLNHYNMQLIGGDTTKGPLSITLTVHGLIPVGQALTRSGACISDFVYVTGTLGDSAAGLAILQNKLPVNNEKDRQYLLGRHLRPQPRILEGQVLRDIASAAIDLSDGMINDLRRILIESDCGVHINLENIPCSSALKRHTTPDQALRWALSGGEDYELCFTVPQINCAALDVAMNYIGTQFTCIGQIKPSGEGIKFMVHNHPVQYNWYGYDHFKLDKLL